MTWTTCSVTADGTVWLSSTYHGSDNDANPPGVLDWALGRQPGTTSLPDVFCGTAEGLGVVCVDPATELGTTYLAGTPINAVAVAPDGTVWPWEATTAATVACITSLRAFPRA